MNQQQWQTTDNESCYLAGWKNWGVEKKGEFFYLTSPDNASLGMFLKRFRTPEEAMALAEKLQAVIDECEVRL